MKQQTTNQNKASVAETAESHYVYNLIILDESGSMESIKQATISGFNETLQTIQHGERLYPEQRHFVALVPFNSCRPFGNFDLRPASDLKLLDETTYRPGCSTPLYDAIGFGISELSKRISQQGGTYNVLVNILTDGYENASSTYSGAQIKTMIETLKPLGWTFTYLGANHDVEYVANNLSIHNRMSFMANMAHSQQMWEDEKKRKMRYMKKVDDARKSGKQLIDNEADYFGRDDTPSTES